MISSWPIAFPTSRDRTRILKFSLNNIAAAVFLVWTMIESGSNLVPLRCLPSGTDFNQGERAIDRSISAWCLFQGAECCRSRDRSEL
jgi:hypothetical protein